MFNNERELVKFLQGSIDEYFFGPHRKLLTMEEVNVGYGIADLVVVEYNEDCSSERAATLGTLQLVMLNMIQEMNITNILTIKERTRASIGSIKKSIKSLVEEGFVEILDDSIYLKQKYNSCVMESIAVEAKLRNWKRALDQAYRYKTFANKSYVCMPKLTSRSAIQNIFKFEEKNVGLMTIDEDGNIKIEYDPPKEAPVSSKMNMLLNECVLSMLNASE